MQALNQYLKAYGLTVSECCEVSNQSPQTLRNWYGKGAIKDKSFLILSLIAAIRWRKHKLTYAQKNYVFTPQRTLARYLNAHNMKVDELMTVSRQSNQTLLNWVNSPEKQPMIDVLIDAVHWYRYAYENNILALNPNFHQVTLALDEPITDSHNKTKFNLEKFVTTRSRSKMPTWADSIKERKNKK